MSTPRRSTDTISWCAAGCKHRARRARMSASHEAPTVVVLVREAASAPYEWRVDHVLADEPHLQFVPANDVADQQVVRAIVARLCGTTRHGARFLDDDLVCVKQTRDLNRRFFTTARRAGNERCLGDVGRHR